MTPKSIAAQFTRVPLGTWPTPLEPMDALRHALGGAAKCPRLWVKHEELLAPGMGGNKIRKMEFIMGKDLAEGVDTVINIGAVQSNQTRQTAASAVRLGMECHLLFRRSATPITPIYEDTGNILICRMLGAHIHFIEEHADYEAVMQALAIDLRVKGRTPMIIPAGATTLEGNVGSALCAEELVDQSAALGFHIDCVVATAGSLGTCAGLFVGLEALRQARGSKAARVLGVDVVGTAMEPVPIVDRLQKHIAELADIMGIAKPKNYLLMDDTLTSKPQYTETTQFILTSGFVGPGYARVSDAMLHALRLVARTEGLLLDPVYTGKTMAALLTAIRNGLFHPQENVVFLHSGGQPALFAYAPLLH